jgi:hypothetical protein
VKLVEIGTFARTNEQLLQGLKNSPDFVELRMDANHQLVFSAAKAELNKAGIPCTLHLPSDRNWKPVELSQDIIPYIDLARLIDA